MSRMKRKAPLFLIPLAFFTLGLVNIHTALAGFLCMFLPFFLLFRERDKVWCKHYCPRIDLMKAAKKASRTKSRALPPAFFRWDLPFAFLTYFAASLLLIAGSTLRVAMGAMDPMEELRFLVAFPLPSPIPQLLSWSPGIPWLTHLAYRLYSMMMTTTVLGLLISLFYKPRSWCQACPIGTLSDMALKKMKD